MDHASRNERPAAEEPATEETLAESDQAPRRGPPPAKTVTVSANTFEKAVQSLGPFAVVITRGGNRRNEIPGNVPYHRACSEIFRKSYERSCHGNLLDLVKEKLGPRYQFFRPLSPTSGASKQKHVKGKQSSYVFRKITKQEELETIFRTKFMNLVRLEQERKSPPNSQRATNGHLCHPATGTVMPFHHKREGLRSKSIGEQQQPQKQQKQQQRQQPEYCFSDVEEYPLPSLQQNPRPLPDPVAVATGDQHSLSEYFDVEDHPLPSPREHSPPPLPATPPSGDSLPKYSDVEEDPLPGPREHPPPLPAVPATGDSEEHSDIEQRSLSRCFDVVFEEHPPWRRRENQPTLRAAFAAGTAADTVNSEGLPEYFDVEEVPLPRRQSDDPPPLPAAVANAATGGGKRLVRRPDLSTRNESHQESRKNFERSKEQDVQSEVYSVRMLASITGGPISIKEMHFTKDMTLPKVRERIVKEYFAQDWRSPPPPSFRWRFALSTALLIEEELERHWTLEQYQAENDHQNQITISLLLCK